MPLNPSLDERLAQLRAGDDEAARQVFHRFAGRLIALARSRLDPWSCAWWRPRTWSSRSSRASSAGRWEWGVMKRV